MTDSASLCKGIITSNYESFECKEDLCFVMVVFFVYGYMFWNGCRFRIWFYALYMVVCFVMFVCLCMAVCFVYGCMFCNVCMFVYGCMFCIWFYVLNAVACFVMVVRSVYGCTFCIWLFVL